jgi:hypothetical protein
MRKKLKRIKHNTDFVIIPRLPMEVRDSMRRCSTVKSKRKYNRHESKKIVRDFNV